jgi:hypothetical protein
MIRKISRTISGARPERRLVEHHEARARHHRAPDREHLLLAAAETSGELTASLLEHRKQREDALQLSRLLGAISPREAPDAQILQHRHAREHPAPLGHVHNPPPDDLVHRQPDQVLSKKAHRAAPRPHDPRDRPQQRRFPSPIRPDQRHHRPLRASPNSHPATPECRP